MRIKVVGNFYYDGRAVTDGHWAFLEELGLSVLPKRFEDMVRSTDKPFCVIHGTKNPDFDAPIPPIERILPSELNDELVEITDTVMRFKGSFFLHPSERSGNWVQGRWLIRHDPKAENKSLDAEFLLPLLEAMWKKYRGIRVFVDRDSHAVYLCDSDPYPKAVLMPVLE